MHTYHFAYDAPAIGFMGDGIVKLDHRINQKDLKDIRTKLRQEYGYTENIEIFITFIYKLGDE